MIQRSLLVLFACATISLPVSAADSLSHFPLSEVIEMGVAQGKLDGSVTFYLDGQSTPKRLSRMSEDVTNKKTNAFGKSSEDACNWAALSALIAFQNKAKQMGANAVVDMHSWFKKKEFKHPKNFECGKGAIMAGVTLKGTYAKVAE